MSYQQYQQPGVVHKLNEFVPTYVPHSDYLPNKVVDSNQPELQQWIANYEQQKRLGHVYTQKPVEFNPSRYVSVRTYENVVVNKPISEAEFNSRIKRV
uniref:Predicted protein n=1 Tax=Hordeum vulgare subsp. vulgare TaxID=112509 RepID=F2DV51_HORVV|nr:predicted protein [Hordeum vulgare subsp. vulgare]